MKYLLTIALLSFVTVAYADDLTLKVAPAEADVIWKGLRKLPVEEVEVIMGKLRQQVVEQTQPKKVEETPKPEFPPNDDMVKRSK